jgi:hypothetical protein
MDLVLLPEHCIQPNDMMDNDERARLPAAIFVMSDSSILQMNAPSSVVNCIATVFAPVSWCSIMNPPLVGPHAWSSGQKQRHITEDAVIQRPLSLVREMKPGLPKHGTIRTPRRIRVRAISSRW